MRTGDGIPAGRVADGLFYLSPQPYVQLHESADVSQIEIVERSIFGRVGIDLSRVRVIEHIHEMQHLSCLLSCEHRTKFLNMHNNPIHIGLESPAPGMIRAAALSKLDELADGSPMPTDPETRLPKYSGKPGNTTVAQDDVRRAGRAYTVRMSAIPERRDPTGHDHTVRPRVWGTGA